MIGFYGTKVAFPYCKHLFPADEEDDAAETCLSTDMVHSFGTETMLIRQPVACASLREASNIDACQESEDIFMNFLKSLGK